jgi:hypothetical protein
MVSLRQDDRGNYSARMRIPDDLREEYRRLYGARYEAKFSAPFTVGLQEAQRLFMNGRQRSQGALRPSAGLCAAKGST